MGSIKIYITNLGKYVEGYLVGQWLELPVSKDKLDEVLRKIGITPKYEEYFITDFETEIAGVGDAIGEYTSINNLNELARCLEDLSENDREKLEAVLKYEDCGCISDILQLIERLDDFDLLSDVQDDEGLGYYYADECGYIDIPENIKCYFDYEAFGRDIRLESCGYFTPLGYVADTR